MPSSISNSKAPILAITFGLALTLSIAYAVFVPRIFPAGGIPENMQQENRFRVEDYLFRESVPRIVIVGSSKAARLEAKFLPTDTANLAMAGYSAEFGLRLILASETLPKIVFIEMNETIMRPFDASTFNQWTTGPSHWLAQEIPAMRLKYRPSSLLNAFLKRDAADIPRSNESLDDTSPPNLPTMLQLQLDEGKETPAFSRVHEQTRAIRNLLHRLRERRVRILLFDLPTHSSLKETARARFFAAELRREFPVTEYEWLEQSDSIYNTSDGVHLLPGSAQRFTQELLNAVN